MTKPLERLKQRFKDRLADDEGKLIEITEASQYLEQPAYACAVISGNRKNRCFQALENDGQIAFCAEMMIQCLTDDKRKHLFQNGERLQLLQYCAADDIELIAGKISALVFGSDNIEEVIARERDTGEAVDDPSGVDEGAEERAATKNLKKTSK